jgi:hypothetical protein
LERVQGPLKLPSSFLFGHIPGVSCPSPSINLTLPALQFPPLLHLATVASYTLWNKAERVGSWAKHSTVVFLRFRAHYIDHPLASSTLTPHLHSQEQHFTLPVHCAAARRVLEQELFTPLLTVKRSIFAGRACTSITRRRPWATRCGS